MTRDFYEPATDYLDLGALLPNLRRYATFFLCVLIAVPILLVFGIQSKAKSIPGEKANKTSSLSLLINRNNLILPATLGIPGPEKVMYSEIDVNQVIQNTIRQEDLKKYLKANKAAINFTVFEKTVLLDLKQYADLKSSSNQLLEIVKRVTEIANSEAKKIAVTYAEQALELTSALDIKTMIYASAENFRYLATLTNPQIESHPATPPIAASIALLKWLFLGLIVASLIAVIFLFVITYCGKTIVTERTIHLEFQEIEILGQVGKKNLEDWLAIGAQIMQFLKNEGHKNILLIGLNVDSLPSSAEQLASSLNKTFAATPIQTSESLIDVVNEADVETLVIAVCQCHRTTKSQLRNFVKLSKNSSSKFAGVVLLK
jgi:hypothetical protein